MQLATAADNKPWICTLHFYADEQLNLYWISLENRRHSQELAINPLASVTILVHENTPEEDYVIGITVEGKVELVGSNIDEQVGNGYINKLAKDQSLLEDISSGNNAHKFYKLIPSNIVLFDSKDFKDNPRQELKVEV